MIPENSSTEGVTTRWKATKHGSYIPIVTTLTWRFIYMAGTIQSHIQPYITITHYEQLIKDLPLRVTVTSLPGQYMEILGNHG